MISIFRRTKKPNGSPASAIRLRASTFVAAIFGLVLLIVLVWPLLAAAKLDYFVGNSLENELTLEWITSAEVDLLRWDVYCKDELQPPAAYHLIGFQEAIGQGGNGGAYTFPVPELTPGVSYCFRISEVSLDASTGESYEICGYGYGVTPTPSPTPTPTSNEGVVSSGTADPLSAPISGDGSTLPEGAPTSTPTAIPVEQTPTLFPTATITATPLSDSAVVTDTDASLQESPQVAQANPAASTGSEDGHGTADTGAASAVVLPPTPDPGYIVITATPTAEAIALLQPTFTPLPTATAEPVALIAGLSEWGVDNLVLATLCFVFFGAGGLGVLGITSLGLYVRSRSGAQDRRRSPLDDYTRR